MRLGSACYNLWKAIRKGSREELERAWSECNYSWDFPLLSLSLCFLSLPLQQVCIMGRIILPNLHTLLNLFSITKTSHPAPYLSYPSPFHYESTGPVSAQTEEHGSRAAEHEEHPGIPSALRGHLRLISISSVKFLEFPVWIITVLLGIQSFWFWVGSPRLSFHSHPDHRASVLPFFSIWPPPQQAPSSRGPSLTFAFQINKRIPKFRKGRFLKFKVGQENVRVVKGRR